MFFGTFANNQMAGAVQASFWIFYSIPLDYLSASVPVSCWFCYYGSILEFEVSIAYDSIGYLGSLVILYKFYT
jgi:hypothetical protein